MGQGIVVQPPIVVGDVLVIVTDRNLTGMGAASFESASDADGTESIPARLAARLHAADAGVRQVYVAMNAVIVRRVVGWDDAHLAEEKSAIEDLFVFYSGDGPI